MSGSTDRARHARRAPICALHVFTMVLGAACALPAGTALATDNQWTRLDIPVGAERITISELNPNRILLRRGTWLDRSNDGGSTWERVNHGIPDGALMGDLAADPDNPDRWIASLANRLFQTTDNGASWTVLKEFPATSSLFDIRDIDWCGSNIYVATSLDGVYRSTDDGATFALANNGMAAADKFATTIGCRKTAPGVVWALMNQSTNFAAATGALYRSTDGGATWTAAITGLASLATGRPAAPIAFGPGGRAAAIIPASPRQIAVSTDDGLTFVAGTTIVNTIANQGSLAWTNEGTPRLLATGVGVNTSIDNGVSWGVFNAGLLVDAPNVAASIDSIQVLGTGAIWASGARVGLFKSSDGIAAFVEQALPHGSTRVNDVVIHPTQPGQMLAVLSRFGLSGASATGLARMLVRSLDGGQTWSQVGNTWPFGSLQAIELKIDPGLGTSISDATLYASDTPLQPGGHFWRSSDGGATWTRADTGLVIINQGSGGIRTLLLDPVTGGAGTRTLWLALDGRFTDTCSTGTPAVTQTAARIWRTTNSGTNWASIDTFPLPTCVPGRTYRSAAPRPVALARTSTGILLAGTVLEPTLINANDPVPQTANGFWRSLDGGTVWTHSSGGLPRRDPQDLLSSHRDVTSIAVMPGNDQILFAAVSAMAGANPQRGAIYKSTNGGDSWSLLGGAIDGDPRELTIDPANTSRMYFNDTTTRRIFASEDGGVTWGSMSSGFNTTPLGSLIVDNVSAPPRMVMAGSSGVFVLQRAPDADLDGVPSSVEAGAPNGGDGNLDTFADNQQANVASIAGLVRRALGGPSPYLTIEVVPITGTCASIEDVRRTSADELPFDAVAARTDALEFSIPDCTSARITIHGETIQAGDGDAVRMFGPTVVGLFDGRDWRNASSPQFFAGRFSFTVNDDVVGDGDLTVGRMQYTVKLGQNGLFGNGFE